MKTIELGRAIEIDVETDDLLERVAESEGEVPDAQTLRAAIPDRKQFIDYLKRRNLTNAPEAQAVLAQLGPETTKRAPLSAVARLKKLAGEIEREIAALAVATSSAGKGARAKAARKPRMGRNPLTGQAVKIKAKTSGKKGRKATQRKFSKTPHK